MGVFGFCFLELVHRSYICLFLFPQILANLSLLFLFFFPKFQNSGIVHFIVSHKSFAFWLFYFFLKIKIVPHILWFYDFPYFHWCFFLVQIYSSASLVMLFFSSVTVLYSSILVFCFFYIFKIIFVSLWIFSCGSYSVFLILLRSLPSFS